MGIGFVKWGKMNQSIACFDKAYSLNSSFDNARHNADIVRSLEGQDMPKNKISTSIPLLVLRKMIWRPSP